MHSILIKLGLELGIKYIYAIPAEIISKNYSIYGSNGEISMISSQSLMRHYQNPYMNKPRWLRSTIHTDLYEPSFRSDVRPKFIDVWKYTPDAAMNGNEGVSQREPSLIDKTSALFFLGQGYGIEFYVPRSAQQQTAPKIAGIRFDGNRRIRT